MSLTTLRLRPAGPADEAFFAALYRTTRDDLLALPLDPAMLDGLVAMQHRMQVAGYRNDYPDARYQVLELEGRAVDVEQCELRPVCGLQGEQGKQQKGQWPAAGVQHAYRTPFAARGGLVDGPSRALDKGGAAQ